MRCFQCSVKSLFKTSLRCLIAISLALSGAPTAAWAETYDSDRVTSNERMYADPFPVLGDNESYSMEDAGAPTDENDGDLSGVRVGEAEDAIQVDSESCINEDAEVGNHPVYACPDHSLDDEPLTVQSTETNSAEVDIVESGDWGECSWSIDSDGLLRVWPSNGKNGRLNNSNGQIWVEDYYPREEDWYFPWYTSRRKVVSVVFDPGVLLPSDCSGMFYGCTSLTTIDVSGWDTSMVTKTNSMFHNCSSIVSLDVSDWDMTWVRDMSGMFYGCSSLTSLDVSNWDTSSAKDLSQMFGDCSKLASLDVSNWDTSSVIDMNEIFGSCSSLVGLDVSDWNTSHVDNMDWMFFGCSNLSSLELSSWDTSSVLGMCGMFSHCSSLTELNISDWNTASVMDTSSLFYGCSNLVDLDISNWHTSNVWNMNHMFRDCSSLTALDLSGWDTASVFYMNSMFSGCSSLVELDISGWDTYSASDMEYMFSDCSSLDSISVGKKLDISNVFPYPLGGKGEIKTWWSVSKKRSYTVKEIRQSRSFIADTYVYADNYRLENATIADISDRAYTGKPVEPVVRVTMGEKHLIAGTDYSVTYKNNINVGAATVTVTGKGSYTGTIEASFVIIEDSDIEMPEDQDSSYMYRLYNPNSGEHFYTASAVERDALVGRGWKYEGIGWIAPMQSQSPVYRLYNANAGDHHYTTSAKERDALQKAGWKYEGIGWYSDDTKGVALYRQYNPYAITGSHNYTTNKKENNALVKLGWKAEGIGWYGVKQ